MTNTKTNDGGCLGDNVTRGVAPCQIVIFGASGDLTARKLVPSLFDLFCSGSLPGHFQIIGCARTKMSQDQFRERLYAKCSQARRRLDRWHDFVGHIYYQPVVYDSADSFVALKKFLQEVDPEKNMERSEEHTSELQSH